MRLQFKLEQCFVGSAMEAARGGDEVSVLTEELLGPSESTYMTARLEEIQREVFRQIPGMPPPSKIDKLLVVITRDLHGIAYVDDFELNALVRVNRPVQAGELVLRSDIACVQAVRTGVEVPLDAAVISVLSLDWKRSLYYNLSPLVPNAGPREAQLDEILGHQLAMLFGVAPNIESGKQSLYHMEQGINELDGLLKTGCEEESIYQGLLERHPWMFGTGYTSVSRHQPLDDEQIPDFTAKRSRDGASDLFELKQPFLPLFRKDGNFSSNFNMAWGQCERYLLFTEQQRSYLWEKKKLRFENPRCYLVVGYQLESKHLEMISAKQSFTRGIEVRTFDQILQEARSLHRMMSHASEPVSVGNFFGAGNVLPVADAKSVESSALDAPTMTSSSSGGSP